MNIAIVGSNKGIGLKLTERFMSDENKVFAFCRSKSDELSKLSPYRVFENFDVTEPESMKSVLKELDVDKLDVVVNVSGILFEDHEDNFEKELIEQFRVNAIGPINTFRAFSPFLHEGSKFAVLTSQLGSLENNIDGGRYGYRMSKAAANMACKNLSVEAKKSKISVLMLHPGYVATDMTGHSANIDPESSAEGLKKIIDSCDLSDTGSFWHVNGERLPW